MGGVAARVLAVTAAGLVTVSLSARAEDGAPGVPAGLSAIVRGGQVSLFWSAPAGQVSGYVLEAGSAPGLADIARLPTGSRATSFTASEVAPGRYYVRVRAVSGTVPGPPSAEALIVVDGRREEVSCNTAPLAPWLVAGAVMPGQIMLAWVPASAGCRPTGYLLTIGREPGAHDVGSIALPASVTSFAGTAANGQYFLRVQASNGAGRSPASVEVTGVLNGSPGQLAPTAAECFTCHTRFVATDAALLPTPPPSRGSDVLPVSSHHPPQP